jgi:hypothetical protein
MGEFRRWACLVLLVLTAAVCGGCGSETEDADFSRIAYKNICWMHYPQPGDIELEPIKLCLR